MPLTLKIRPLDRRFRTSVYRVASRKGKLRNGEKVCLGKPVEKEGKFNYAVYKVNDANAVVGNLGTITTDDGDLSGEENKSQKLNELDESVWNELKVSQGSQEGSQVSREGSQASQEAPQRSSQGSSQSQESSQRSSQSQESSQRSSQGSFEASREGSQRSSQASREVSEASKEAPQRSSQGSSEASEEAPLRSSQRSQEASESVKDSLTDSEDEKDLGSPTTKDMQWFENSDALESPKTKKAPLLRTKPKSLKIKIQQKNIPVYT
jgi:hypothetical protein